MASPDDVVAKITKARTAADGIQQRVSEIMKEQGDHSNELRAATAELEALVIDICSHFEASMQHHFRRGPFSGKLVGLLLTEGHSDLAERIRQYFLTANVLKHGRGESYRQLVREPNPLVAIRPVQPEAGIDDVGLLDVTKKRFFHGLTTAILEAHQILETRPAV